MSEKHSTQLNSLVGRWNLLTQLDAALIRDLGRAVVRGVPIKLRAHPLPRGTYLMPADRPISESQIQTSEHSR
jgi:hypothetical protein